MGKKGKKKDCKKENFNNLPFVSVCTPTFNRRPFIKHLITCFNEQDYPKDRMEWIIVDDGSDKIEDLVNDIPQIKYIKLDEKVSLGKKRNIMHSYANGEIIVYMDDDDYYPPERVSHAVKMLQSHPSALCAGSSEIYIYFKHLNKIFQFGPYAKNHATAGTFAFKKKLLKDTQYNDDAALAEEKDFLKNYTVPFVQLDPMKVILVFSHEHNTFDKKKLLGNKDTQFCKESSKTVKDFVKNENLIEFFTNRSMKLKNYPLGLPKNKPDVIEQIKIIDEKRKIMERNLVKQQQQRQQPICGWDGEKHTPLDNTQIIQILQKQSQEIMMLTKELEVKNQLLENFSIIN